MPERSKFLSNTILSYFWGKVKTWANTLFALDSATVHKTGNETIAGTKTFSSTIEGNTATANKVNNDFILKIKSGTAEGASKYTFNGSAAKTLDIKQGNNITLSATTGSLTIAATDSHYTTHLYAGNSDTPSKAATENGDTALVLADNSIVRESIKLIGANGTTVTSDANNNITISGGDEMYPISTGAIDAIFDGKTPIDRVFDTGSYGTFRIKFFKSNGDEFGWSDRNLKITSNIEIPLEEVVDEGYDLQQAGVTGMAIYIETNYSSTEDPDVMHTCIGNSFPNCSASQYTTWNYALENGVGNIEDKEGWNSINFDPSTLANDGDEVIYYLNYKCLSTHGGSSSSNNTVGSLLSYPEFAVKIKRENNNYKFTLNYTPVEENLESE